MIYTFIAYAPKDQGRDLGWSYNKFMELLPNDDDWACFLDHDAMFTTRDWYHQLCDISEKYENVGCFAAMTNRLGVPLQIHGYQWDLLPNTDDWRKKHSELLEANHQNHDFFNHRKIGKELFDEKYSDVKEMDLSTRMGGVVMLVKKSVWKQIKFRSGFLGVDRCFQEDCIANGYKVFLMEGVYVYHWYRADGDHTHLN